MAGAFAGNGMPPSERLAMERAFDASERVEQALADFRRGKFVILVDDEDRENEGDLCLAAELVTPEAINFMVLQGRGLICLALTEEQVHRLDLPMMGAPGRSGPKLGTAFTVSIEARDGVTTGISAADRAHTIRVASRPEARPDDVVVPGHIFPLQARHGGVLVRAGQTEGSVDLARLAGLSPSAVICEIIRDDGTMARLPDLEAFAERHSLRILTIADLIAHRLRTERLVRVVTDRVITLDRTQSPWRAVAFESVAERRQIVALVKGALDPTVPTLCRMHRGGLFGDVFSSSEAHGGRTLGEAIDAIERAGSGVIVYLLPEPGRELAPDGAELPAPSSDAKRTRPHAGTLREYGLGAQVLAALGVHQIRLLTNNPRRIAALHGYGLDLVECVALG
ncbi:MAG TPA: 3,4-dihydroxy-2-butanone-4-phosphate synthase [Polyangiaceae bacterium]|nr:3,4-dihydroxy-2-butanone-4-phosphate synthase [Polyangiaceae bacterium]